jgi:alkylated DNA repair protein alkB family protein 6
MTTIAIDFRELRRQERQQRVCATKSNGCVGVEDVVITTVAARTNSSPSPPQHENNQPTDPDEYEIHLSPYQRIGDEYRIIGIRTVIDSVFYMPNFLPSNNQRGILTWLTSLPEHLQHTNSAIRLSEREESLQHNGKWTRLKHARRKVALFDGTLCPFPPILQRIASLLVEVGAFPSSHPPNHVLVNEYQPGEGIMPHTDGPAYASRTATISLGGSDVIFKLWPRNQNISDALIDNSLSSPQSEKSHILPSLEVILHGNGSLVLFINDAYLNYCHEISEGILEEFTSGGTLVKRGHRFSLTFRHKKK